MVPCLIIDDSTRVFLQLNVNKLLHPEYIDQVRIHFELPFSPAAGQLPTAESQFSVPGTSR